MSLVISGDTEKKLDTVLDDAHALLSKLNASIDAGLVKGVIEQANETTVKLNRITANLDAMSADLKLIVDKLKLVFNA